MTTNKISKLNMSLSCKLFTLATLTLFSMLHSMGLSASCVKMDAPLENVIVSWTAFKTPAKVGVGGKFKKFTITSPKTAKTIDQYLSQTSFTIDTTSVATKDISRDKKIVTNFFNFKNKSIISGKFLSMKKKVLKMELTLNGVTKTVPLSLEVNYKKSTMAAKGHIDVLDFILNDQLSALNKACFALHEGKTWSDIVIKLDAQFTKC